MEGGREEKGKVYRIFTEPVLLSSIAHDVIFLPSLRHVLKVFVS